MDLRVSVWRGDREAGVTLAGELDASTAPIVRAALVELFTEGFRRLTLNLPDLEFIDAAGISVLLAALRRARDTGGDLALRSPTTLVRRTLELTHVIDAFTIAD